MKILHSADFHLNAPFSGRSPEEAEFLRRWLMEVPAMVADLCLAERCDLVLLAGDLFDSGDYTAAYPALYAALERMAVPVFITPGNHDYCDFQSPWLRERWPENVHVFTRSRMESVALPRPAGRIPGGRGGAVPYRCASCRSNQPKFALLSGDSGTDPGIRSALSGSGTYPQGGFLFDRGNPVCLARLYHGQRL